MKIRTADRFDFDIICDMLRNYRMATPWKRFASIDNEDWIKKLLTKILAGAGVAFIAEKDQQPVGMLLAIKNTNVWDPEIYLINELAYWVEPEHRGSTAGYKLIRTYVNYCTELKEQGAIEGFTISKMVNSPDLDYSRFGFEKLEEMWRT